jgi:hypothetical protein
MTLTNTPIAAYKRLTLILRGSALRKSSGPRRLVEKLDLIEFQISNPLNHSPLLKKSSATGGIQIADDGSYIVTIPAAELSTDLFPDSTYEYSVIITEGDTGQKYAIRKGPLVFEGIAQPS